MIGEVLIIIILWKRSEETRKKIGEASKGRWLGRKHSEESKKKMSEARRKRGKVDEHE
jgi:hypothetical protein